MGRTDEMQERRQMTFDEVHERSRRRLLSHFVAAFEIELPRAAIYESRPSRPPPPIALTPKEWTPLP